MIAYCVWENSICESIQSLRDCTLWNPSVHAWLETCLSLDATLVRGAPWSLSACKTTGFHTGSIQSLRDFALWNLIVHAWLETCLTLDATLVWRDPWSLSGFNATGFHNIYLLLLSETREILQPQTNPKLQRGSSQLRVHESEAHMTETESRSHLVNCDFHEVSPSYDSANMKLPGSIRQACIMIWFCFTGFGSWMIPRKRKAHHAALKVPSGNTMLELDKSLPAILIAHKGSKHVGLRTVAAFCKIREDSQSGHVVKKPLTITNILAGAGYSRKRVTIAARRRVWLPCNAGVGWHVAAWIATRMPQDIPNVRVWQYARFEEAVVYRLQDARSALRVESPSQINVPTHLL